MTLPYLHLAPPINDAPAAPRRRRSSHGTPVESTGESTLHANHPDAQTILRIRAGDQATFAQLFRDHYRRLWAFAYDLTGSPDHAEEVVQDVFASIWTRRAEWSVTHSIAEYLFGAVRNRTYKMRRHLAIADRTADTVTNGLPDGDPVPALGAPPPRPDEATEHAELHDYVTDAIRAMPPGRRTALLLRWHDGLSYAEIASAMGVSVKAVSFQLSRARDDLWTLVKKRI